MATVTINSLKDEFSKNNPMSFRYRFHFKSGKLAKIENLARRNVNRKLWKKEVDSLVNGVKLNHPEFEGFISDLAMKGTLNYMKAIALYKNRESTP
ncbi:hypothetical protein [Maribacter antarcticus]|uniref:hypothetical protein n=1 Tax=Maribacter antarcticus TaxID=505250 RepID=UPI00047C6040|nr:hypothetical protein [Maribacter antarcticus]